MPVGAKRFLPHGGNAIFGDDISKNEGKYSSMSIAKGIDIT